MNIVITGKLSKPRNELIKEFANCNVTVLSSMKPGVDYLVTDTPDSGTSKNIMAQRLGIIRISESLFRQKFLGEKMPKLSNIITKKLYPKLSNPITETILNKLKPSQETTLTRYLDF